ncbi:MAG TPA: hypothetical protein VKV27_06700 [Solirubrobacteraceae bacterium]|nr:hypothetical protein [Solirubrobacteraceae bacterium]
MPLVPGLVGAPGATSAVRDGQGHRLAGDHTSTHAMASGSARPAGAVASGRTVIAPLHIELELELEPGDQAPRGLLRAAQQAPREFTGYVQLISALESLRHPHPYVETPERDG